MIKITNNIEKANAITHGGTFHSDDVLATVILEKVFGNITVCRTFEVPEKLANDIIVYDIGFGKYDHHQKGGNGSRENGVPYASAGLIWRDFGRKLVEDTCNPEMVWHLIDRDLIQGVDATDNGKMPSTDYPAQVMSFPKILSGFNPEWDSETSADEAFLKAIAFAKTVFENTLANAISLAKAKSIVDEAIKNAEGHIMVLDKFIPWQEFIFSSTSPKADDILFVVFPSTRGGYNWQCVPDTLGGFGQRKPVPTEWKGLHDLDYQKVTGVKTAIFCHPAGFIGGAETLEDAISIAKLAVES